MNDDIMMYCEALSSCNTKERLDKILIQIEESIVQRNKAINALNILKTKVLAKKENVDKEINL
jgi:hypothetical protein